MSVALLPPKASAGKFVIGGLVAPEDGTYDYDSGDLDGDGDVDVLYVTNTGVSWVKNTGGSFDLTRISIDPNGRNISVADLDGDGDLDVITDNNQIGGHNTYWYENDGSGQFTHHVVAALTIEHSYLYHAIELFDVDQDGDLDFMSKGYSGGPRISFGWLENDGHANFTPRALSSTGDGAVGIPVDLDRDGDVDFVETNTIYWYENTGNFKFVRRIFPQANSEPFRAALIADLDHDGLLDVAGVWGSGGALRFAWQRNNGNHTFTSKFTYDVVSPQFMTMTAGDVNGDGHIDLVSMFVSYSREETGVIWFKNDGVGNFSRQWFPTSPNAYPTAVNLADLDNDGDLDIFGTTSAFGPENLGMSWFRNVSTSVSLDVSSQTITEGSAAALVYTFHRDAELDRPLTVTFDVAGSAAYSGDYTVSGATTFSASAGSIVFPVGVDTLQLTVAAVDDAAMESNETVSITLATGGNYVPTSAAAIGVIIDDEPGDFGDAPQSYATTLAQNGARHTAVGPRLGLLRDHEADGQPSPTADGDDNDDGVQFSVIRPGMTDAAVIVHVENAPLGARLNAWIDFNGDGNWDGPLENIAKDQLLNEGDNVITFDVPPSAQSGTTFARFRLSSGGNLGPYGAASDGEVEDYAVQIDPPRPTSGEFSSRQTIRSGTYFFDVEAGDLDRDGDVDLVTIDRNSDRLAWYENNGQGIFTRHQIDTLYEGLLMTLIDIDGDDDLDIVAVYDSWNVQGYINDGAGNFTRTSLNYYPSRSITSLSTADVDGDGDMDLLIGGGHSYHLVAWAENRWHE